MRYENVRNLSNRKFRRNVGIKRETFEKMLEILGVAYNKKHKRRGRKPKLSLEDQLLAALEYWREYRTYARIALDFGISESNMYRGILWIEDVLIKDGTFNLPGKKELLRGVYNFHKNPKIPKKKTKLHPLTREDKAIIKFLSNAFS